MNLGVGLDGAAASGDQEAQAEDGADVAMADGDAAGEEAGEEGLADEDYGALALLDTVIEEREERLSNEDVAQILKIIRETLGSGRK